MTETRTLRLPDGRDLAAAEFGDPGGRPVLYFHGFPGSRLEAALGHTAAGNHGIRLIGLDRPGFGGSDPSPGRRLSDWPRDVSDAADALGLERFAVAGASGGGPYALACAALLGPRLDAVGVLCGLGPPESRRPNDGMMWHNRIGLTLAARAPWLVRLTLGSLGPLMPLLCRAAIANLERHVSAPDREMFADPEFVRILSDTLREAFRRGSAGAIADGLIFGRSWDVDLDAIRVPVRLWHGEDDQVVPPSMTRYLEAAIPGAQATYLPGEGHFSLIVRQVAAILAGL